MNKNKIDIYMLGTPKILFNNKEITNKLSAKAIGILCYIVTNENINREKLAYMFWEDSNADAAKYNLRYNLWSMNKFFKNNSTDKALLIFEKNKILFSNEYEVNTDVYKFNEIYTNNENLSSLDNLLKLKSMYKSDFLEGCYLKGCLKFNDWIFYAKEKYQKKYITILQSLLRVYQNERNYENAIQIIEEMMEINSYDEDLYVELIKIYLELGDRVSALKQYSRCVHVLREELNIAPKESTEKFLKIIKNVKYNKKSYTQYIRDHSNIIYITNEEFEKIKTGKKKLSRRKFIIKCIPIENLNYCFLSLLVDGIIDNIDKEDLEKVNKNIWIDIQRINLNAKKFSNIKCEYLTIETERNRIYYSLFELIKTFTGKNSFDIIIDKLHLMDRYSFDFIKYLLFRRNEIDWYILFTCNTNDSKYIELRQYFKIEQLD